MSISYKFIACSIIIFVAVCEYHLLYMLYCYISPGMQGAIFYYPRPPNQLKLLILHPPLPYGFSLVVGGGGGGGGMREYDK